MTRFKFLIVMTGLLSLLASNPVQAQFGVGPVPRQVDSVRLARIEEWTRVLINELDNLEDDIVFDVQVRGLAQKLAVARKTTLIQAVRFQSELSDGRVTHRDLHREFHKLDDLAVSLIRDLDQAGNRYRSLRRTNKSLKFAQHHLHYFVENNNPWANQDRVVQRQFQALSQTAQDFQTTIQGLPRGSAARRDLQLAAKAYLDQLNTFGGGVQRDVGKPQLRRSWGPVDQNWHGVAKHVTSIPLTADTYQLHTRAEKLREAHGAVADLLGAQEFQQRAPLLAGQRFLGQLQGTWDMIGREVNGRGIQIRPGTAQTTFQGNRYAIRSGGIVRQGTIRIIQQTQDYVHVDYVPDTNPREPFHVILRVEDDTLFYSGTVYGEPRPTTFRTRPGDKLTSVVYKKVKR